MGQIRDAWNDSGAHTYKHTFHDCSDEELETWLDERMRWLAENNVRFNYRVIGDEHIFSFETEADNMRFTREGVGHDTFIHTHTFDNAIVQAHFKNEFLNYCETHDLDVKVTSQGNVLGFYFSDLPNQHHALEKIHDGSLDALAKSLTFEKPPLASSPLTLQ